MNTRIHTIVCPLRLQKIRLDVLPPPTDPPRNLPRVVFSRQPPRIYHLVDPRRAAQRAPGIQVIRLVRQLSLALGRPYVRARAVGRKVRREEGHARGPGVGDWPSFDNEDANFRVGAESVGENASCSASTWKKVSFSPGPKENRDLPQIMKSYSSEVSSNLTSGYSSRANGHIYISG